MTVVPDEVILAAVDAQTDAGVTIGTAYARVAAALGLSGTQVCDPWLRRSRLAYEARMNESPR